MFSKIKRILNCFFLVTTSLALSMTLHVHISANRCVIICLRNRQYVPKDSPFFKELSIVLSMIGDHLISDNDFVDSMKDVLQVYTEISLVQVSIFVILAP